MSGLLRWCKSTTGAIHRHSSVHEGWWLPFRALLSYDCCFSCVYSYAIHEFSTIYGLLLRMGRLVRIFMALYHYSDEIRVLW